MKARIILCLLLVCCAVNPAFAFKDKKQGGQGGPQAPMPTPLTINLGQIQESFLESDSRANHKEYDYDPRLTMKLRLREFMNTTVVLPKGENIKGYSLAENKNFSFSAVRLSKNQPTNIFEVWGKFPGADTSLKVFGESGHIYVFYLFIDSISSDQDPTLICYVNDKDLIENEPTKATRDDSKKEEGEEEPDYLRTLPDVDPSKLNFNYEVADKESELAPIRIFDDGHFTYFQYGMENLDAIRDLPVLYRVLDGVDNPWTNVQIQDGFVIATTTHDRWTIRSGRKWLCVRRNND